MNKKAILVHGWEGSPEEAWRPWLRKELEQRGFKVVVPAMPDAAKPTAKKWVPYLTQMVDQPDKNTYFVGHSLGCITILRYLETLKSNEKVGGAILVAGFGHNLEYEGYKGELSTFFTTPIDWKKIQSRCKKFVAIHSVDDPFVPIKHAELFKEKLGAKAIIQKGMKHYSGDDDITELPIVLQELLKMSNED
ncbi:hypothetical protein CMO96_03960 [Candidatus Woesebacteria bacterium]|nr:hypothetical protein [Candidatus Woesebacteria bacterium]|tara:strand:- start:126 stop:701 length:576 start_codon:yes stop_codon:yes gene_type:complete